MVRVLGGLFPGKCGGSMGLDITDGFFLGGDQNAERQGSKNDSKGGRLAH